MQAKESATFTKAEFEAGCKKLGYVLSIPSFAFPPPSFPVQHPLVVPLSQILELKFELKLT